jgi:hypothetical protein
VGIDNLKRKYHYYKLGRSEAVEGAAKCSLLNLSMKPSGNLTVAVGAYSPLSSASIIFFYIRLKCTACSSICFLVLPRCLFLMWRLRARVEAYSFLQWSKQHLNFLSSSSSVRRMKVRRFELPWGCFYANHTWYAAIVQSVFQLNVFLEQGLILLLKYFEGRFKIDLPLGR